MIRQIYATLTVNLLSLAFGISVGWAAPNMLLFQTEESPIGILNSDQVSLIASILCIGGTVGTIVFGCIVDHWGRKTTMILIAIPQLAANILVLVGTSYYYIYVARFWFGFAAAGVYIMVPIFVAEISQESIRGAMGTIMSFMNNAGIVLGYILSSYMDYYEMPYVATGITILFLLIFIWLPESPDFLEHIGKYDEAERSYTFYGNARTKTPKTLEDKSNPAAAVADDPKKIQKITVDDFRDKAVQRGVLLSVILIVFADSSGVFVITHFLTELFEWAQMDFDIYLATVTVGCLQIVGSIIPVFCIDRIGRRILFMCSAGGAAICLFAFGSYFYLLDRPQFKYLVEQLQWLPLVSLCGVILIATCAISSLPFFIISELMPVKLRGFVTTGCLIVSWVFAFIVVQYFHLMVELLGVAGTMWTYGAFAFIEVFFIYFYLPETKNLTFEEIQESLRS